MTFTRREVLAGLAAAPMVAAKKKPVVGVELYSVRDQLKQDLFGTVREVAKLGYECVEFYSPYFEWTPDYARKVRALLDETGLKCLSTHNSARSFLSENLGKAIELNQIIGSKMVVMASAGGKIADLDGWKRVADTLTAGADKLRPLGMRAGFHNHQTEFRPIGDVRPMEVLAKNTPKDVVLQLDVGTCLEAGTDPVQWVKQNPGRIASAHLKDWGPDQGYKALFNEGAVRWKPLLDALEKTGGIEFYLIEQEGSRFEPMDTIKRCLESYRKLRGKK
ncbi:MAG: sugar phosphate isomerase/epimerase [Acidobacteria bacterium]|nr:sugar phosphate isomerase/epimerase [Acidobacteriota bacterium]